MLDTRKAAEGLRYSILFAGDDTPTWTDLIREADALGFDGLGIGDSPSIYQDVYMRAMIATSNTNAMRIGPMVTNSLLRHPVVTACCLATLDQIVPGRAFVAIGTGDSSAANAGVQKATTGSLERYVRAVKSLLTTGSAEWEGATVRFGLKSSGVPVYVAAVGPKTLQMAGRVAEGVIVGTGLSADAAAMALSNIEKGAREAGRDIKDIDVWFLAHASLAEEDAEAEFAIVNTLITRVCSTYKTDVALRTMPSHLHDAARYVRKNYNAMHHADFGYEGHKELARQHPELMKYITHQHTIVGSPATFAGRLNELRSVGVRNIWIHPRTPNKMEFLRLWRKYFSQ